MKKTILLFVSAIASLAAQMSPGAFSDQKIAVQNSILAKVNGKTISVLDVKKKLDLTFHQAFPQFADDIRARIQFYDASWRNVLMDMIDHELIIADALDKEIKLTDGEVREEIENRFGPSVMQTLDKIGLTYDEAWKMLKNEMIVQRMTWWFIQMKARSSVSPQDVRQAYRLYLQENPAYTEWKYRVVSIRVDTPDDALSEQVHQLLHASGKAPEQLSEELKKLEAPGIAIAISKEFSAKDKELSELHRASLSSLTAGHYSKPSFQASRIDKKTVYRIFYLIDKMDYPAPAFEAISQQLQDNLIQKAAGDESQYYITKLRKHYGYDAAAVLPEELHPFSVQ